MPESRPDCPDPLAPRPAREALLWARGFAALASAIIGLMVLGALVRAHGAGLACPDWPLCFGRFVPEFDLKVAFEWSHRVVAGSISLVYLGLAIGCWRRAVTPASVRKTLVVGGVVLAVQVILGALTVWKLLASWSVTSHLLTANAFVLSVSFVAADFFERANPPARKILPSRAQRFGISALLALLIAQIAVGGLVASKYAGLVCPEWPTCIDGVWFPGFEGARGLHLVHRLLAYVLVVGLLAGAIATRSIPRLGRILAAGAVIGLAQACVGVANVLLRLPVEVTGLHSALAAGLVILLALATREAWQGPRSSASNPRTALDRST